MKKQILFFLAIGVFYFAPAYGAKPTTTSAKIKNLAGKASKTEANSDSAIAGNISAKAFLEDLMTRRYSQALSTFVDKQAFTLGVQLQMADATSKDKKIEKPNSEIPLDLMLGTLDPEKIMDQYGLDSEKVNVLSFLKTKQIKEVLVSVGLREDLGPTTKTDVQKWLNARLSKEFGGFGKSEINFVKEIIPKAVKAPIEQEKKWWDWLLQFQQLASEFLIALAIIVGILLWRMTGGKSTAAVDSGAGATAAPMPSAPASSGSASDSAADSGAAGDEASAGKKSSVGAGLAVGASDHDSLDSLDSLGKKINGTVGKISKDLPQILRYWCQAGATGHMKVACLAEIVNEEFGQLPIPAESLAAVAQQFATMTTVSEQVKIETYKQIYWDLASTLNLGVEVLNQPFGYLTNIDESTIRPVLMVENPRMQTLVTLFMPESLRQDYIKPLSEEEKFKLLQNAAEISSIAAEELRQSDDSLLVKLTGGAVEKNQVALNMTIEKILTSFTAMEEMNLLAKVTGPIVESYKRKNASIAFIHEWNEDGIKALMAQISPDEALAYLRTRPEMTQKMLQFAPPLTAELLGEELKGEDKMKVEEKNAALTALSKLVKVLVERKDINLAAQFLNSTANKEGNNVIPIKSA